jgi:hypothetical protein
VQEPSPQAATNTVARSNGKLHRSPSAIKAQTELLAKLEKLKAAQTKRLATTEKQIENQKAQFAQPNNPTSNSTKSNSSSSASESNCIPSSQVNKGSKMPENSSEASRMSYIEVTSGEGSTSENETPVIKPRNEKKNVSKKFGNSDRMSFIKKNFFELEN